MYIRVQLTKTFHMRDCCQHGQWTASRCFMYEAGYIVCYAFHIRSLAVDNFTIKSCFAKCAFPMHHLYNNDDSVSETY